MVGFPEPNRIDMAVVLVTAVLLFVGYVLYPTHLVRIAVWLTIFTIYVCWMGYLAYRWTFEGATA